MEPWAETTLAAIPSIEDIAKSVFGGTRIGSIDEYLERVRERDDHIASLRDVLPARPRRRLPSTRAIAKHHDLPDQTCWRCGIEDYVERAHIVDRVTWPGGAGLDGPQNLALLCHWCHKLMPIIEPEDWEKGLAYVGLDESGLSPEAVVEAADLHGSGDS